MKETKKNKVTLHFFPYQKFTQDVVLWFNKYFDDNTQKFILHGNRDAFVGDIDLILSQKNVFDIKKCSKFNLFQMLHASDNIIFHYNDTLKTSVISLMSFPKRIHILFWGGDIEELKQKNIHTRSDKIRKMIAKIIIRRCIPINLIEQDFYVLKEVLNIKKFKKHYVAKYGTLSYEGNILNIQPKAKGGSINVLLGNSATKTNNHVDLIDKIAKYKGENIKFYIPLSYGDKDYAQEIKSYAKEKLGTSVIILDQFIDPSKYDEFLNTMDIGVFNFERQQALGNIYRLNLLRKKIYVNSRSGLLEYFADRGIELNDIQNLENINYDEFINFNSTILENNRINQMKELSSQRIVEEWKKILF